MKLKDYFDNPFEIAWGAFVQFPIIIFFKWWSIPVMIACGLLWRWGGAAGGLKEARRLGVPLLICSITFAKFHHFGIFLAAPFMIWACPWSYGAKSWLFVKIKAAVKDQDVADFITRFILFVWYWAVYIAALLIGF